MNKSITKERHMIREYRDSDAQTVRDVFTETHLAEAELMPEYLRQEYRTAVADEVGVKLTNVREGYAALPNRLFIASKADDPGEITGFCALVKVDETTAGLKNVVVSPRHQGQGIARLLMEAFEEHAGATATAAPPCGPTATSRSPWECTGAGAGPTCPLN